MYNMNKQRGDIFITTVVLLITATAALTSTPSNTSSTTAHVQHIGLPVTTAPFNTRHFIEHLSWQPTSLRDVIQEETINRLQPWRWAGVRDRKYETVTTFARVHCCRGDEEDLETDGPADHGAACTLPPPPPHTEGGEGLMSLWVVLSDQLAMEGCVAFVQMACNIGRAVRTPEFLKDFDLEVVDWRHSGLVYLLPNAAVSTSPSSSSADYNKQTPALFLCLIEGSGNVSVSSQEDAKVSTAASPTQYEGEYGAGECVYSPTGWWVSLEAATHTTALLLTWPDDIIITEEFLEHQERIAASESATKQEIKSSIPKHLPVDGRAKDNNDMFLASFLPEEDEEKENLKKLWLKPPVLPHFLQYYYFSQHSSLTQQQFISKIKPDSLLVPNLVDCPLHSECHYLLMALFRALDLNGDGELSPQDLARLTPRGLPTLQLHVDDMVQELRDLALDQWYEAMEASPAEWEAFAERASDRKKESARAVAKRIQDGELTPEELRIIRESLPDLYEQLEEISSLEDEGGLTPEELRTIRESVPDLYEQIEEISSLEDEEDGEENIRDEL